MTNSVTPFTIDKIMVTIEQMDRIDRFTGYDFEGKTFRRPRPAASPEFTILVDYVDGEADVLEAVIVVNNVPIEGKLDPNEPLAIASVMIDDEEYYLLINGNHTIGDRLIQYEGEPEELLQKTHLFDDE